MGIITHHGNSFLSFGVAPVGAVGGWVELGRTTLGSANANITVSSLADKRYCMILSDDIKAVTPTTDSKYRMGNGLVDTGSNYSGRRSNNGSSDFTNVNQTGITSSDSVLQNEFRIGYISNLSANEKLLQMWKAERQTVGAATAPSRTEEVGKWVNTSNPLDNFTLNSGGADTFATGSEVVVLGWDPSDTHTTNFWEEIASVDLSGGAATSLTATASSKKKYNWVQYALEGDGSASGLDIGIRLGDGTADSGTNWARRFSINGGADTTDTSQNAGIAQSSSLGVGEWQYGNLFFINILAQEKLMILHNTGIVSSGAATAPERREVTQKWVNTSAQADIFQLIKVGGTGSLDVKTQIKWWGSN